MIYENMAKEQVDRNRMLFEYHKAHPGVSYTDLAKRINLSRQRAYYLVQRQLRKEVAPIGKRKAPGRDRVTVGRDHSN